VGDCFGSVGLAGAGVIVGVAGGAVRVGGRGVAPGAALGSAFDPQAASRTASTVMINILLVISPLLRYFPAGALEQGAYIALEQPHASHQP
jgi:uncharacterized membrane protein YfcA